MAAALRGVKLKKNATPSDASPGYAAGSGGAPSGSGSTPRSAAAPVPPSPGAAGGGMFAEMMNAKLKKTVK